MSAANPLLEYTDLPPFEHIRAEHIPPALEQVLADNRAAIARLVAAEPPYTWDSLVRPLEALQRRIERVWSPVQHLHAVADSDDLRAAYKHCQPLLSAYYSELSQNAELYAAYRALADSPVFAELDPAQQKTVSNELRDFHLGGVDLASEKQARFKQINQQLGKLSTQFSEHLLDATHGWKKHILDENELAGLPDSAKALARAQAEREELDGWLLTLDLPCYLPVMNYCQRRELREEMYRAFVTRASELGPNGGQWDNGPLMEEILALRHEQAQLLDFPAYADYSLATKMAENPQQVLDFLRDLAARARPAAERDWQELQAFAAEHYEAHDLSLWDVPFYSERLREHRYAISQEALRPYFPLPRVLDGLFQIVERLYGIDIQPREDAALWHEDARCFEIKQQGEVRGWFYLDPYARPSKRGGAWMGGQRDRYRHADGRLDVPIAYLNCNFPAPTGGRPSLLTHQDVTTLFHEFGHGLHHLLTRIDFPSVAGISGVPWDAVELPSQFMENWAWEREALDLFAAHYETGAPLPDDLFEKMRAAKNFQAGLLTLRQLEFALFDFRLHTEYQPGCDQAWIQHILDATRAEIAVIPPPDFNRFQHSFQHIFSGGYAAGYYSYKWAEVLSADAFSRFEEEGIFNPQTGADFLHHILEQGGAHDPRDLFARFRGRAPQIDALLRHAGLAK